MGSMLIGLTACVLFKACRMLSYMFVSCSPHLTLFKSYSSIEAISDNTSSFKTSLWIEHKLHEREASSYSYHILISRHNRFSKIIFLNLFLAVLGLRCCTRAFSSCGEHGLLIAVTSLVAERRLSSCGARA